MDRKGLSLIEVMVAGALLSGLIYGFMSLMANTQKGQQKLEVRMDIMELRRALQGLNCAAMLTELALRVPHLRSLGFLPYFDTSVRPLFRNFTAPC